MSFKEALSVMPTRPALALVPVIVIGVLSFYYYDLHAKCTNSKQYREKLTESLRTLGESERFYLAELTGFDWDKVRIITRIEPNSRNVECPFGWNWASGERDRLLESRRLSAMIFARRESIVSYFEFRSDEVAFDGVNSSLTPEKAQFEVAPNPADGNGFLLKLN